MRTVNTPISKETYKRLKKLTYVNLYDTIQKEELLPVQYFCGYGVYNVQLFATETEYYIRCDIGDTCD